MNSPPLHLLRWYTEMGMDVAIGEHPVDRFGPSPSESHHASKPQPMDTLSTGRVGTKGTASAKGSSTQGLLTADPKSVALAAHELALAATNLDELKTALERFEGCALKATASQLVFRDGAPQASIMLVGEAPGAEEDRRGLPFVGRSGQLLDRVLAAIGLDRTQVAIANVIPWRPPGNRTPTPQEIAVCKPFIERQIELVAPEILVCLGAPSAQTLLGVTEGILKLRGRWMTYDLGNRSIRAIATLHPAYLLRQPLQKRLVWRDFQAIKAVLNTLGGGTVSDP